MAPRRRTDELMPEDDAALLELRVRRCLLCGCYQVGRLEAWSPERRTCRCGGVWVEFHGATQRALALRFLCRQLFTTPRR